MQSLVDKGMESFEVEKRKLS